MHEEHAITEGDMLAHGYEDAIKVTDAARDALEKARKAYDKARTDEVALEIKLNERRQERLRRHEETKRL